MTQRLIELQIKNKKIHKQLLKEHKAANIIIEAIDESTLKQVSQIIERLRALQNKGMPNFDKALNNAIADLNKYTAGGLGTKALAALKGVVGIKNPVVKILAFAGALENGFKQLPVLIKNSVGEIKEEDTDKTITALVADENQKKTLINNMRKALAPPGVLGTFKKIPYMTADEIINDLAVVPIKNLIAMIKTQAKNVDVEKVAKDIAPTEGDKEKGEEQKPAATEKPGKAPNKEEIAKSIAALADQTNVKLSKDFLQRLIDDYITTS